MSKEEKDNNSDLVADKTGSEKWLRNGTLTPNPVSNTSQNNEANWLYSRFQKLEHYQHMQLTVIVTQLYKVKFG